MSLKKLNQDELIKRWSKIPGVEIIKSNENLIKEGELVKEIRKILWMEEPIELLAWREDILEFASYLYKNRVLVVEEYAGIVKVAYSQGMVNNEISLLMIDFLTKEESNFNEWAKNVKTLFYKFSLPKPELKELIEYYRKNYGEFEEREALMQIDTICSSLKYWKEEYVKELKNLGKAELIELLNWVDPENLSTVSEELVRRNVERVEAKTWESLEEEYRQDRYFSEYPQSYNVLGDKLTKLPVRALDMKIMDDCPQEYVASWAPKFAYSKPETEENFKLHFPGGEGIGHSAILLKTRHGLILFDFGMSVLNNRIAKWLPLLEKVDAIFISHAHLDHSGGLPLLLRNSGNLSKTPWFGTRDTKTIAEMLYHDMRNVVRKTWKRDIIMNNFYLSNLTNKSNVHNTLNNFEEIKFGQTVNPLPNVSVTSYKAAHLFGACGYKIEIGSKRLLYTGDFNLTRGKLFPGAKFPTDDLDLILFDGTNYRNYEKKVPQLDLKMVLYRCKRVLIPAFSMGRTQELLQHALEATYRSNWKIVVTGMGGRLIRELKIPINRKNVIIARTIVMEEFKENTIVIAGNGMLQAGTARQLLEYSKEDEETAVVFCGYQSPNTLGHSLLYRGYTLNYKQQIYQLKISGHANAESLDNFLSDINGDKVVVHFPGRELGNDKVMLPRKIMGKRY